MADAPSILKNMHPARFLRLKRNDVIVKALHPKSLASASCRAGWSIALESNQPRQIPSLKRSGAIPNPLAESGLLGVA